MQSRSPQKNIPAAARLKRAAHAFYFVQPFLQFLVLMGVILVLSRCSPLSPSQERLNKDAAAALETPPTIDDERALEHDIDDQMRDITEQKNLPILSLSEYIKFVSSSLYADKEAQLPQIRQIFGQHANPRTRHKTRLLTIAVNRDQRARLLRQGSLRINLAEMISEAKTTDSARRALFEGLREMEGLKARVYLVLPDDAAREEDAPHALPVSLHTRMAYLSDDRYFLQVKREDLDESQKEVIESNFARAIGFAVVLD